MSPLLIEGPECGYTWRSGDGILRAAGPGSPTDLHPSPG